MRWQPTIERLRRQATTPRGCLMEFFCTLVELLGHVAQSRDAGETVILVAISRIDPVAAAIDGPGSKVFLHPGRQEIWR